MTFGGKELWEAKGFETKSHNCDFFGGISSHLLSAKIVVDLQCRITDTGIPPCMVHGEYRSGNAMRNEDKVIGADVWLQDIFCAVSERVEGWNSAQRVMINITAHVRAVVAAKLQLLEKGKLQPLDRETYRAAVATMVEMLVGKDADPRAIKTARQNITSGSRWNFGVFSPSDKRRAQVGKAKAAKKAKAKAAAKGMKNAAMTAIANAVSAALKRGVTHLQIVDTLNRIGTITK